MGVSFSWRTIKKFIIPILLGALAYLGFNGIFDNFNLGLIQANAIENYDTIYNLQFRDLDDLLDSKLDDNITYREFFDYLSSLESEYYRLIIGTSFNINSQGIFSFPGIRVYLVPISVASLGVSLFGLNGNFNIRFNGYDNQMPLLNQYLNSSNVGSDIYNSPMYLSFLDCFQNNNCTPSSYIGKESISNNFSVGYSLSGITNDSNNEIYIPRSDSATSLSLLFLYSSQVPIYILNDYNVNNSSYFYKKVIFYDRELSVGDYLPTYKDYIDSLVSEEPDNPSTEETIHKKLFNKIYWFDDSNTEKGILSSIYILLFLYCLTMILFKIATFLRSKRW